MQNKIAQLEQQLIQEKEKTERLEKLLKVYERYVPVKKLQYLRGTEEETNINVIQKALKRKKQTQTFVSSGKFKIFLNIELKNLELQKWPTDSKKETTFSKN
jgi:hypothetical protein